MKKSLFTIILITGFILSLSAQKSKDVLYLKNGSKLYGKLLEVSDSQYKLKTNDGSIFIYPQAEVDRFVNETIAFEGRKTNGLGFALEAGFLVGAQNTQYDAPFSFNFLGNYTKNTKNIFGIGSGVEFIGESFVPLFVEYKRLISDKKTTPFIFFRSGKLFHFSGQEDNTDYNNPQYDYSKSYKGGFTMTIGTGISWVRNENETYLSFAYRNAFTSYTQLNYNNQEATYKTTLNRLEVKFGFRF
jgi:hypothetical protein